MWYQNEILSTLWEWQPRLQPRGEAMRNAVPRQPVQVVGEDDREAAPMGIVAAAWALVFALAALAFAFSAVP